jgi:hypothetical protein
VDLKQWFRTGVPRGFGIVNVQLKMEIIVIGGHIIIIIISSSSSSSVSVSVVYQSPVQ